LADDMRILVSRQVNDPQSIQAIINASGHALVPAKISDHPHPQFVRWHRETCFKQ